MNRTIEKIEARTGEKNALLAFIDERGLFFLRIASLLVETANKNYLPNWAGKTNWEKGTLYTELATFLEENAGVRFPEGHIQAVFECYAEDYKEGLKVLDRHRS